MRNFLALALLSATAMLAGDLSGVWTGTLTRNTSDGPQVSDAYVILKQEGPTKLAGTGGPSAEEQLPLNKVVVDGEKITFEVETGNGAMKFAVVAKNDTIEGDVVQERSDGTSRTGKIALKRKP